MSKKSPTKRKKTEKPLLIAYAPQRKSAPAYTREDIESILTTVMLTATAISATLLTITLFIGIIKH